MTHTKNPGRFRLPFAAAALAALTLLLVWTGGAAQVNSQQLPKLPKPWATPIGIYPPHESFQANFVLLDRATGVNGYGVQYWEVGQPGNRTLVTGVTLNQRIGGLKPETSYRLRYRSNREGSVGPWSGDSVDPITTLIEPPPRPASAPTVVSSTSPVQVSFGEVDRAATYQARYKAVHQRRLVGHNG